MGLVRLLWFMELMSLVRIVGFLEFVGLAMFVRSIRRLQQHSWDFRESYHLILCLSVCSLTSSGNHSEVILLPDLSGITNSPCLVIQTRRVLKRKVFGAVIQRSAPPPHLGLIQTIRKEQFTDIPKKLQAHFKIIPEN